MKFGVLPFPNDAYRDVRDVVAFAQAAEKEGFDFVGVPDHVAFPAGHQDGIGGAYWDAIVLATHLLSRTERVRILFSILVLPQRNPVVLARQIATVDGISNGRIDVGLGVGWLKGEFDILGEDFSGRGARFDEYVSVMKALWAPTEASFSGRFFEFDDVAPGPALVQRPHPPLWIGGGLPRNGHPSKSIIRAASYGDAWNPMHCSLDELRDGVALLHAELIRLGRDPIGFPVRHRLAMWGRSARANQHAIDAGGGLSDNMGGDFALARDYVDECARIGVTHLSVDLPEDRSDQIEAIGAFAEHVIRPHARSVVTTE